MSVEFTKLEQEMFAFLCVMKLPIEDAINELIESKIISSALKNDLLLSLHIIEKVWAIFHIILATETIERGLEGIEVNIDDSIIWNNFNTLIERLKVSHETTTDEKSVPKREEVFCKTRTELMDDNASTDSIIEDKCKFTKKERLKK